MSPAWPVQVVPRLTPDHFPNGRLTVAVFGPGEGEAIVVTLPDSRLGVLDGCAEREDPVATLIEEVDGARGEGWRFAFMGLTHPHDDHYAGLCALQERYHDRIDQWWEPPLGERGMKTLLKLWEIRKKGQKAYWRNADLDSLPRGRRAMERVAGKHGKAFGLHLTVTPASPRRQGVGRSAPPPTVSVDTGAKSEALPLAPRAGRDALSNAVAVTLDAAGTILQVVLAGEAGFYA